MSAATEPLPDALAAERRTRRLRAEAGLGVACFLWGSTFVVVKDALAEVSTLLFLAFRFGLAALALALVLRVWKLPFRTAQAPLLRTARACGVAGLLLFCGYWFQTWGLEYTTPTKSAFLTGLNVVMVPLLAGLVYRNGFQVSELIGAGMATSGMALMTLNGWSSAGINPGDLLTLLCAFSYSLHVLVVGHYTQSGVDFRALSFGQIAVCALLSAAGATWGETPRLHWTAGVAAALAVTSLLATALAFTLMAWAQQHTSAARAALIFALEPVFAWLTSFLVIGERLSMRAFSGAVLILAGVVFVELKPVRRR